MGFFDDLKKDLSQAVNELVGDEELLPEDTQESVANVSSDKKNMDDYIDEDDYIESEADYEKPKENEVVVDDYASDEYVNTLDMDLSDLIKSYSTELVDEGEGQGQNVLNDPYASDEDDIMVNTFDDDSLNDIFARAAMIEKQERQMNSTDNTAAKRKSTKKNTPEFSINDYFRQQHAANKVDEPAIIAEQEAEAEPATIAEPLVEAEPVTITEQEAEAEPATITEQETQAEPDTIAEPIVSAEPETIVVPEIPAEQEAVAEPFTAESVTVTEPESGAVTETDTNLQPGSINESSASDDVRDEEVVEKIMKEEVKEVKEVKEAKQEINVTVSENFGDEVALITKGLTVKGDVDAEGGINILGTIEGNIKCKGKMVVSGNIYGNSEANELFANNAHINGNINCTGSVKIGQGSIIIGNVAGTSAVIAGAVKGDIDIHGPVVVDSSAIVMGDIKSKSVQINIGAAIEGRCSQCYADVSPTNFFKEN